MEVVWGEQDNSQRFCGLPLWCSGCTLRDLEKGITLTFQKYVLLDAKRQLYLNNNKKKGGGEFKKKKNQ